MREIIVTTKKVTQASVSISKGGYHPLTPNMSALALTLTIYIISFFENPQSPLSSARPLSRLGIAQASLALLSLLQTLALKRVHLSL